MLDGLNVLDITEFQGLLCGKILADMGAEVIRLQKPGTPITDCYANRGKHAVSLDYTSSLGKDLFLRVIAKVDVLIERLKARLFVWAGAGFRPFKSAQPPFDHGFHQPFRAERTL